MCLREEIDDGLPAALVYETRFGALKEPLAEAILDELRNTTEVVVVVDRQQRRRRLSGRRSIHAAEATVSPPHFLNKRDLSADEAVQQMKQTP